VPGSGTATLRRDTVATADFKSVSVVSALISRVGYNCNAEERFNAINYMFNSRFALLPAIAAMVAASNVSTEAM
jgi:hypothetical protein